MIRVDELDLLLYEQIGDAVAPGGMRRDEALQYGTCLL